MSYPPGIAQPATAVAPARVSLWPREHGAYGQVAFPLLTAFAAAGVSAGGVLTAVAVLAGFLAHEPAAVVLGLRGPRAQRQAGALAGKWLAALAVAGGLASTAAVLTLEGSARWSLAIPAVPALLTAVATLRGLDKTSWAEASAALAFSGAAAPVVLAADADPADAAMVAIPFALLFVTTTLAVKTIILKVRGGGNRSAAAATRRATLVLAAAGAAALVLASSAGLMPTAILIVASPGLLTASILALRPPPPTQLRRIGWTLVSVTAVTALLVVTAVRQWAW